MTCPLLILRPEPGNVVTCARAQALGLEVLGFPLFETRAVDWDAPEPTDYVGVMLTSANAARLAGPCLNRYTHLPLFAVGEATADAAKIAGFISVVSGEGDVSFLLAKIATLGLHKILHLAGEEYRDVATPGVEVDRRTVYAAEPSAADPALADALARSPVALLHSPRAATRFAALVDQLCADRSQIKIAAISANAAACAGDGWQKVVIAPVPRDEALINLAATLSKTSKAETL
jgi:uroporphyrinogen-III synthase